MPVVIPPSAELPNSTLTYIHAYKSIVRRFRANRTKGAASVVILAGVDADALLASSLLITLLKQDDIPHTLIPITGYAELEKRKRQMFGRFEEDDEDDDPAEGSDSKKDFSDIQSMILISLGSLLPLSSTFPLPSHLHIHVIDSHRPYNLENLFGAGVMDGRGDGSAEERRAANGRREANGFRNGNGYANGNGHRHGHVGQDEDEQEGMTGRVWVWTDGEERKLDLVKKSWEALEYEPEEDSGSDSDSETSSSSSDDDDDEHADGSETDSDATDPEDTEQDEPDEEDGGSAGPNGRTADGRTKGKRKRSEKDVGAIGGKRKKKKKGRKDGEDGLMVQPKRLPAAARKAHSQRVQKYYHSGTSYGLSAVESLYLLASEMERGDNDLLWLAIVGLTYHYITAKLDRDDYDARHQLYMDEVARLNSGRHGQSEQTTGLLPASQNGAGPDADDSSIAQSEELRFVLYKHWNLYDAMFHSSYVAGRMGIWKERGRKRLMGLLAKMGYSGQQCRQSYAHMDMDLRNGLRDKLEAVAPEYGLVELTYPSFTRAYGYRCSAMSAADAIEGVEALLEAGTGIRIDVEYDGGKGGGEWFSGTKLWTARLQDGDKQSRRDSEEAQAALLAGHDVDKMESKSLLEQTRYQKNFWVAYDALKDIELLRRSLSLARALHQAIIRQGCSILDKGGIRGLRAFRFVTIKEGPDLRLFCNASTLSRLANWLVDATRDKIIRKAGQLNGEPAHPIVIACLNEEKSTYMVVGVTGSAEFGDIKKNRFGLAFQSAAEESGAGTRHDMFETSVVEVRQDELTTFIECLHLRSF